MWYLVIGVLIVLGIIIGWRYILVARPVVPPLEIDADDPLMLEAVGRAKDTFGRFRALLAEPGNVGRVKVPCVTSAGVTEYLWADVLALKEEEVDVRYLTPPVSHSGRLERLHTHPLSDVVDWSVERPSGKITGGYTMRVMFLRGREQWGSLPPLLAAEEKKYEPVDS